MKISELYQLYLKHPSISTDSRNVQKGDLFFALKGGSFNGNLFAKNALDAGASYAIVDEEIDEDDGRFILVNNALVALQQLAKFHREQFSIPFIAITGSNGKTTTKELLHAVLSSQFRTYTTQGNLNNHIGIPLTILKVKPDAELAIIEMGANHQKEIASYCEYVLPSHGLITNIGKAHLEGFGGEEGVKKGKGELFDFLSNTDGTVFINTDDVAIMDLAKHIKHRFSYGKNGVVKGEIIQSTPFLHARIFAGEEIEINSHLVGKYNLPNILAAICVGQYFGISLSKIKKAIENYHPENSRSQLVKKGSNTFILDEYNANPSSMKAAIENFSEMEAPHKILLLGEMRELGNTATAEHQAVVDLIDQYSWDEVVLVGPLFENTQHHYAYFNKSVDAKKWFQSQQFENTFFLLKGSRGVMMEQILGSE